MYCATYRIVLVRPDCRFVYFTLTTAMLSSARLVALFSGMRFDLLVERHICVARLWIAMSQMPFAAEFAAIYPEFRTPLTPALIGCLLGRRLVLIHDLVRLGAALWYEIMHSCSVYSAVKISVSMSWHTLKDIFQNDLAPPGACAFFSGRKTKMAGPYGDPAWICEEGDPPHKGIPLNKRLNAAACYSPTPFRVQYHRRARP